jgi:hypothetical protein
VPPPDFLTGPMQELRLGGLPFAGPTYWRSLTTRGSGRRKIRTPCFGRTRSPRRSRRRPVPGACADDPRRSRPVFPPWGLAVRCNVCPECGKEVSGQEGTPGGSSSRCPCCGATVPSGEPRRRGLLLFVLLSATGVAGSAFLGAVVGGIVGAVLFFLAAAGAAHNPGSKVEEPVDVLVSRGAMILGAIGAVVAGAVALLVAMALGLGVWSGRSVRQRREV